jgi:hypothetical protein
MTETGLPTLTILGGPMAGTKFVLDQVVDNVLIGSDSSCGFCVPLPGVSPIHARLWIDADGVTVYDTNSPKGLYVNDDRVVGQSKLRNGDILWLGAPGDEDVIMIQCRMPTRAPAAGPKPAAAAPSTPEDVTLSLGEVARTAAEQPPPGAEEASAFDVVVDAPTVIEAPPAAPSHGPASDEGNPFDVVVEPTLSYPPQEATVVMAAEEDPARYAPPPEPAAPEAPLPTVPAFFEDETISDVPAPATPRPPSPAPAPEEAEAETVIGAAPVRPAAEPPTVIAPAPVPPPAAPAPAREERPAPKPATAPAVPRPRPAAPAAPRPRPATAPAARPAAPRPKPGGAASPVGRYAAFGVIGLLVVAGASYGVWVALKPGRPPVTTVASLAPEPSTMLPAPTTTVAAAPETPAPTPEATPPVEESVTVVKNTPTPSPSPKVADKGLPSPALPTPKPTAAAKATPPPGPSAEALRAQQLASQVNDLVGQADGALSAHKYEAAVALYDEALKLDPQNSRAATGKTTAMAGAAVLKRSFVPGRTTVQSGKAGKGNLSGFESEDVSVAKAPDYSGRIEFEASPAHVKPGDAYAVKVFLVNDGKKSFKIGNVTISTFVNGSRSSGGPVGPPTNEVGTQQRVQLQEVPGVWQDGVNAWALDVVVTSNRGDTFKNQLSWR